MSQRATPDPDDVRVLFVEDDASVAQMYRLKLELDGYSVDVAGDAVKRSVGRSIGLFAALSLAAEAQSSPISLPRPDAAATPTY